MLPCNKVVPANCYQLSPTLKAQWQEIVAHQATGTAQGLWGTHQVCLGTLRGRRCRETTWASCLKNPPQASGFEWILNLPLSSTCRISIGRCYVVNPCHPPNITRFSIGFLHWGPKHTGGRYWGRDRDTSRIQAFPYRGSASDRFSDVPGWHGWYYLIPRCPTSRVHWHFHPEVSLFNPSYERVACWRARCHQPGAGHWRCQVGSIGASLECWMGGRGKKHSMLGSRSERHEPPQKKTTGIYLATICVGLAYVLILSWVTL